MRRPGGQYSSDAGGNDPYGNAAAAGGGGGGGGGGSHMNNQQQHHQHQQQLHNKADNHHHHHQNQWRWERDVGPTLSSPMSPHILNEDLGGEAARSYQQGQRPDPRPPDKHRNNDARSQRLDENINIGYEDNVIPQTFEGLEQKFLEDIMKLSKEQSDAEDAENARHRERINAINVQYQEQLVALRSQHASCRDEFLRKESHARQQRYQQAALDSYPGRGIGPRDPHGYNTGGPPAAEPHRAFNSDNYDAYRERPRYIGNARDHGFEARVPYPGGRVYDPGSRYH